MRHGWHDPKRGDSKMAIGIYYFPGGLADSHFVRPATVELENGNLVEVPLILVDDEQDVVKMMAELKKNFAAAKVAERLLPPKKEVKRRGPKPQKKKK